MPDTSLNPMEMFLMAAVSRAGLDTLYALQRTVGLQPGSLSQVIKGLAAAGLMVRSEGAKRGRRAMALTDAGERFLTDEWKTGLDPKREMETVLRGAAISLLMGEAQTAIDFLIQAAYLRRLRPVSQALSAKHPKKSAIDLYGELRSVYEYKRRVMEAAVLEEFGAYLAGLGCTPL